MRIYTTRHGELSLHNMPELHAAQVRYLLTTLLRYAQDVPSLETILRMRYLADPSNRDTWYTPKEALMRGGDDCEGLSNLLAARLLLDIPSSDGLPIALPCLTRFRPTSRVIHAVTAVRMDCLPTSLQRWCWQKYPITYPTLPSIYRIIDMSWLCGMGMPLLYVGSSVVQPHLSTRVQNGLLHYKKEGVWM